MKTGLSRRTTMAAALGAGVLAAAGLGLTRVFRSWHRYPSTPYDDLLSQLDNREAATKLGHAFLPQLKPKSADALATALRARLGHGSLVDAVTNDSRQGAIVEAMDWVLPETLAKLCALAALAMERA